MDVDLLWCFFRAAPSLVAPASRAGLQSPPALKPLSRLGRGPAFSLPLLIVLSPPFYLAPWITTNSLNDRPF